MDTSNSLNLQYYWSLTTRLFSVICRTFVAGVLPLFRVSVCVFYNSSWLGHRILIWGSYPSAEMQSVCSTTPADWATGHSLVMVGVLPLCRVAVGVFYSPSQQGHRIIEIMQRDLSDLPCWLYSLYLFRIFLRNSWYFDIFNQI